MDTEVKVGKNILLVEDDPQDAQLILAGLAEHDLDSRVVVVPDGEKALNYLYRQGTFRARAGLFFLLLPTPNRNPQPISSAVERVARPCPR